MAGSFRGNENPGDVYRKSDGQWLGPRTKDVKMGLQCSSSASSYILILLLLSSDSDYGLLLAGTFKCNAVTGGRDSGTRRRESRQMQRVGELYVDAKERRIVHTVLLFLHLYSSTALRQCFLSKKKT